MDPHVDLLRRVFANTPHVFPTEEYSRAPWLEVLRASGMQRTITPATFEACARQLDAAAATWSTPQSTLQSTAGQTQHEQLWKTAHMLATQLQTSPTLHAPETLSTLRTLRFLPAYNGIPGAAWAPKVLAAPSVCVAHKDWQLAWAAVPVLSDKATPPTSTHVGLGLRSPPVFDTIAQHLNKVQRGGGFGREAVVRVLGWVCVSLCVC